MVCPVQPVLCRQQHSAILSGHSRCQQCLRVVSCASYTVARYCSTYLHGLQVMITSFACTSYRHLNIAQVCLENMQALLHAVAAMPFFILMAHGLRRTMRHVSAPELSCLERRGLKPCDTRQRQSPSLRWGEVRIHETRGGTRALLSGEAGSRAAGCMAALEPS
jgi:hypothetical protein